MIGYVAGQCEVQKSATVDGIGSETPHPAHPKERPRPLARVDTCVGALGARIAKEKKRRMDIG